MTRLNRKQQRSRTVGKKRTVSCPQKCHATNDRRRWGKRQPIPAAKAYGGQGWQAHALRPWWRR